jgi:hypothetical protein
MSSWTRFWAYGWRYMDPYHYKCEVLRLTSQEGRGIFFVRYHIYAA